MSPEIKISVEFPEPPVTSDKIIRLNFLKASYGFLPTTREELSNAYSLASPLSKNRKAGKKLLEVRGRILAGNDREDPATFVKARNSVQAVRNSYIEHYRAAINVGTHLKILGDAIGEGIDEFGEDPNTPLNSTISGGEVGAISLIRFVDLRNLSENPAAESKDFDAFEKRYTKKIGSREMLEHFDTFLSTTTYSEARLLIDDAMSDQYSRGLFWGERVSESNTVAAAHGLGRIAIAE
jgi:hypothetical protein